MWRTVALEVCEIDGMICAPDGLESVLVAAHRARAWQRASLRVSGYDGSQTVRLEADGIEFDSEPLGGAGRHLFNGAMTGTITEAIAFVRILSQSFAAAGITHCLEIYDAAKNLVTTFGDDEAIGPPLG